MADALASHCEAVRAFVEQLGDTSGARKILVAQKKHIEQRLEQIPLTVQDAGRILRSLEGIPWPDGAREALTSLIAERSMSPQILPCAGRSKMQDFRAFTEYLTGEMWEALAKERTTAQARIDLLLGHAAKLQLRCPSEATFQRLAAVFLTCSEGHDRAFAMSPHLRYNSLQHLKSCFKALPKEPLQATILALPQDPAQFMSDNPGLAVKVFGGREPVPYPFKRIELDALARAIPMRSTSKMMTASASCSNSPTSSQGDVATQILAALQQMVSKGMAAQPVIRMLPRKLANAGKLSLQPSKAVGENDSLNSPMPDLIPDHGKRSPLEEQPPTDVGGGGGNDDDDVDDDDDSSKQIATWPPVGKRAAATSDAGTTAPSVAGTTAEIAKSLAERGKRCKRGDDVELTPPPKARLAATTGSNKKEKKEKSKGKGKAMVDGKLHKKPAAHVGGESKRASYSMEWSREQVMARGRLSLRGRWIVAFAGSRVKHHRHIVVATWRLVISRRPTNPLACRSLDGRLRLTF
jgi:hypothetical protein